VREKFDGVRAACERIGRDPATVRLSVALTTIAGGTDAQLEARAAATGTTIADFRSPRTFSGGPDEIAEKVSRLRDLGADRIYFQLMDLRDVDHVDYLGSEVLPAFPR
jgi:alkanesulfonate monooxygenase SsuD/methylene tetrahydromethanopterin reductase-like flavin-dependent oxidoreductase (luciferase family)